MSRRSRRFEDAVRVSWETQESRIRDNVAFRERLAALSDEGLRGLWFVTFGTDRHSIVQHEMERRFREETGWTFVDLWGASSVGTGEIVRVKE